MFAQICFYAVLSSLWMAFSSGKYLLELLDVLLNFMRFDKSIMPTVTLTLISKTVKLNFNTSES